MLTDEIAYITTKNANSKVMKSEYEISQRSWFSGSSSYGRRARRYWKLISMVLQQGGDALVHDAREIAH